jgi:hypothetical protein
MTRPFRLAVATAALVALSTGAAEARHRPHHWRARAPVVRHMMARAYDRGAEVQHPSGCPRVAFCGCGASVHVFGRPVRELYLAANWFRFPRSAPAPGMAAVRRHHVMVLERQVSGGVWLVYDANSGGHRTRVHVRSIAGYAVVNPRAVEMARR